jgi:uracil-DNA glycosylase family 4
VSPLKRPRLYLVGEAPGAEEAEQGRPFVGAAGSALRKMVEEAGIDARKLRLANAIPFRPIAYSKDLASQDALMSVPAGFN